MLTNSGSRSDIVSIEVHYLNTETVRTGLTEGKFGTICLDKNVTTSLGASFYEIAYREDQNGEPYKVNFDEVKTLEAGVPYIFLAEDEQITVVYGDETAIAEQQEWLGGYVCGYTRWCCRGSRQYAGGQLSGK